MAWEWKTCENFPLPGRKLDFHGQPYSIYSFFGPLCCFGTIRFRLRRPDFCGRIRYQVIRSGSKYVEVWGLGEMCGEWESVGNFPCRGPWVDIQYERFLHLPRDSFIGFLEAIWPLWGKNSAFGELVGSTESDFRLRMGKFWHAWERSMAFGTLWGAQVSVKRPAFRQIFGCFSLAGGRLGTHLSELQVNPPKGRTERD